MLMLIVIKFPQTHGYTCAIDPRNNITGTVRSLVVVGRSLSRPASLCVAPRGTRNASRCSGLLGGGVEIAAMTLSEADAVRQRDPVDDPFVPCYTPVSKKG